MTQPNIGLGGTVVDLGTFCCCDPKADGCPHLVASHGPDRCGPHCPCTGPKVHTATCIHQQPQTGGE